jgi:hypothetical protein
LTVEPLGGAGQHHIAPVYPRIGLPAR